MLCDARRTSKFDGQIYDLIKVLSFLSCIFRNADPTIRLYKMSSDNGHSDEPNSNVECFEPPSGTESKAIEPEHSEAELTANSPPPNGPSSSGDLKPNRNNEQATLVKKALASLSKSKAENEVIGEEKSIFKSWCHHKSKAYTSTHQWKIDNFSYYRYGKHVLVNVLS